MSEATNKWCGVPNCLQCVEQAPDPYVHLPRDDYQALRDECERLERLIVDLPVHIEQVIGDLHAALNGTRHDPSWIRPIQLSRNERRELYLNCEKQLNAIKAALTASRETVKE